MIIIYTRTSERYTDEQRKMLSNIWNRFEAHNRANGASYMAGEIDFSFSDISLIGRILKEDVDYEIGLNGGAGFCRNATNAFLELNRSFVIAGGEDNTKLRIAFEGIRERLVTS